MTRRILTLLTLATLVLGACSSSDAATIELVDPDQAQDLLAAPPEGLEVLDVRTPEEFDAGHLADAENLDFYASNFTAQLDELDKDTPYFVYCRSGNRSSTTIETMQGLGFTEVYELEGGLVAWSEAGYPIDG